MVVVVDVVVELGQQVVDRRHVLDRVEVERAHALDGHGGEHAQGTEADAATERVGLAAQAGQLVSTLSGGQRSRASLAAALVSRPEVLVLDEPTVGQDPLLRDELWKSFRDLANEGSTLLVSSHVMDEANRCDRLILIREGEIIADDTPDAVKAEAGTDDLDEAFLWLIRARGEEAA